MLMQKDEHRKSMKFLQHMMTPVHSHKLALKNWGFEYWFENNKQYCGKILMVRKNEWSSFGAFHYHRIKDETFLVLSGTLILDILDLNAVVTRMIPIANKLSLLDENVKPMVHRYYLKEFDYMRLRPWVLHRFSALTGEAVFTETSTTHHEEDSYRIAKPDAHEQTLFRIEDDRYGSGHSTSKYSCKYSEGSPSFSSNSDSISSTRDGVKDPFLEEK